MTTPSSIASESLPFAVSKETAAAHPAQARTRIEVIDVMRGLVMVLMLLDHVRETFYLHRQVSDPMDVATTEPSLFFSRLAAHFCAPMFVFLTGLGAWLYANPASGVPRDATGFLVKRGLLLIVLEVTVVTFAWNGKFPPPTIWLQVIWVIGLCMIILGLMHRLPKWILATVGFALVFGHNALTPIHFEPGSALFVPWTILHDRGYLIPDGFIQLKVSYPLLPWIGVILLGYLAGPLYAKAMDPARRARAWTALGIACLALLAVLRGFNIYGETLPWVAGQDFLHTFMSWVNFTKYPPSLDFLLLTLGVGFLLFPRLEAMHNGFTRMLATFGGAPMFYYLLHLYVLLALQLILVAAVGPNHGERFGIDVFWPVWVISLALVPVLYFPCRAFARYKRTTDKAWVRYF
jgi:uncharacterized membrane protein